MASTLEAIMLICFGLSWPINAYKGFKARTARGSSWQFIALITFGYVAGIAAKFASGSVNWVLAVYFINLACLGLNWTVYLRNRRLDAAADRGRLSSAARDGRLSATRKPLATGFFTKQERAVEHHVEHAFEIQAERQMRMESCE